MMSSAIGLLCEVGMLYEWDRGISDNFEDKRMKKCKILIWFFFFLCFKFGAIRKYVLYFSVVRPVLIISIALSGVYLIFSILLLKGIKEVRCEIQNLLII